MTARRATPADPNALREPRLPAGRDMDGHPFRGLHYRHFRGNLFVGDVSGFAVGQGDLGDCFFLSSLAALANTHPDLIRRAIADNGDGSYTVTFQERKRGKARPVPIRVDARFPADSRGAQTFGKGLENGPDGQELWPALFEKAYAAWQGGYVIINEGGDGGAALTGLTGRRSRSVTPNQLSSDALWLRLWNAAQAGDPMITSTPFERELERRTGRRDLAGLIEGHYYAVVGAHERRGQRFVELYTPLVDFTSAVVSTPSAADNPRRTIELTLEHYRRYCDQLAVNGMSG